MIRDAIVRAALLLVVVLGFFALTACASKPLTPPQAPPAVEVLVPVATPCKVEQVVPSRLPTASAAIPDDIWDAAKLLLADREVLKADRAKLTAANSDPCPTR